MALTPFQRDVCRLLADERRAAGESYVAGGVALNVALNAHRVSRDLDLFHDTTEAVARSWDRDRTLLEGAGYGVSAVRERPGFVEAVVSRPHHSVIVQWVHDSAYRFFPLVEHDDFGLTLHPFDLATNKVLALIGRVEPRDWVDVMACHERMQPFAYLAWAACGKDPGFTPSGLLEHARRTTRYSGDELSGLAFDGPAPGVADLSRRWRDILDGATAIVDQLPAAHVGEAVLTQDARLFTADAIELARALAREEITFHSGRIGGALPRVRT